MCLAHRFHGELFASDSGDSGGAKFKEVQDMPLGRRTPSGRVPGMPMVGSMRFFSCFLHKYANLWGCVLLLDVPGLILTVFTTTCNFPGISGGH